MKKRITIKYLCQTPDDDSIQSEWVNSIENDEDEEITILLAMVAFFNRCYQYMQFTPLDFMDKYKKFLSVNGWEYEEISGRLEDVDYMQIGLAYRAKNVRNNEYMFFVPFFKEREEDGVFMGLLVKKRI